MGPLAVIPLIIQAAGLISGTAMNAAANKKEEKHLKEREDKLNAWYDKNYNTNILDTDEAKGTMQLLRNQLKETQQSQSQANAMRGSSDEKAVATATENQKVVADTALNIASKGTDRKNRVEDVYMQQDYDLAGLKADSLSKKSQNWANVASNAGGLLSDSLNTLPGQTGNIGKTPLVAQPPTDDQRRSDLLDSIMGRSNKILSQSK